MHFSVNGERLAFHLFINQTQMGHLTKVICIVWWNFIIINKVSAVIHKNVNANRSAAKTTVHV